MNDKGNQFYEFVKSQGITVPDSYEEFKSAMQDENTAKQFHAFVKSKNITVPESVVEFQSVFSDGGAFVNFTEGSEEPQKQPSKPLDPVGEDIRTLVKKAEAADNYNAYFGSPNNQSILFEDMTVGEVLDWQSKNKNKAVGAYQFKPQTLKEAVEATKGISLNSKFDPTTQDTLFEYLLDKRGYQEYLAGTIDSVEFGNNLAKEFASLPVLTDMTTGSGKEVKRGETYWKGTSNKALIDADAFESTLAGPKSETKPEKQEKKVAEDSRIVVSDDGRLVVDVSGTILAPDRRNYTWDEFLKANGGNKKQALQLWANRTKSDKVIKSPYQEDKRLMEERLSAPKTEIDLRKKEIETLDYEALDAQLQELNTKLQEAIRMAPRGTASAEGGIIKDLKKQIEQVQEKRAVALVKHAEQNPDLNYYNEVVSKVAKAKSDIDYSQSPGSPSYAEYSVLRDFSKSYIEKINEQLNINDVSTDDLMKDQEFTKEGVVYNPQLERSAVSMFTDQTGIQRASENLGYKVPDKDKIKEKVIEILKSKGVKDPSGSLFDYTYDLLNSKVNADIIKNELQEKRKESPEIQGLNQEVYNRALDKAMEPKLAEVEQLKKQAATAESQYLFNVDAGNKSLYQQYVDAIFELDSRTKNQLAQGLPEEGVMRAYKMEQKRLWDQYQQFKDVNQKKVYGAYNSEINAINAKIESLVQSAYDEASETAEYSSEDLSKLEAINKKLLQDVYNERDSALESYEQSLAFGVPSLRAYASELGRSLSAQVYGVEVPRGLESLRQATLVAGDNMQQDFEYVPEEIESVMDLLDLGKFGKTTAKLAGSMTTGLIASSAAATLTGGLGAIPALATSGLAAWGMETLDMRGQIERDVLAATGDPIKAAEAGDEMVNAQLENILLYSFEGLPFVGKALRGMKPLTRVAAGAAAEIVPEFLQEFEQTAQEQAIKEKGSRAFAGLYQTPDMAKRTFLNIAPVLLLGGGSQAVGIVRERIGGKEAALAIKNTIDLSNVSQDGLNQYLLRTHQQQGPTFTKAVIDGFYENGMINKAGRAEMLDFVNNKIPQVQDIAEAFGLTPEQSVIYNTMLDEYNRIKKSEESATDEISKSILRDKANVWFKSAREFLENPNTNGAFIAVRKGGKKGDFVYLSTAEFQDYISQPGVAQSILDGDINFYARNVEPKQIRNQIIKKAVEDAITKGIITESGQPEYQAAQEGRISTATSGSDSTIEVREVQEEVTPEVEIKRIKQLPIEAEDGATFNQDGTSYGGVGLVIPVASVNTTRDQITPEMITDFVEQNKGRITSDNVKVGIYKFPNSEQVSIDLNIVADPSVREEAIAIGKEIGQESLFDLATGENIKTGATGASPKQLTDAEFIDIQKRLETKQADGKPKAGNRIFNQPLTAVKSIADKYYQRVFGQERPTFKGIDKVNEEFAKRVADAYEAMENNPNDPEVKAAYDAMAKETMDQYRDFIAAGYKVEINNQEPYNNAQEMINDLRDNKRIKIFSTESGFGDEPITEQQRKENPLLQDSGMKDVNGNTLLINDVFRAIHDFYGHAELGNGFGAIGEENAWNVHARMFSPLARRAMTSETRGQNSWVNFSGVNEEAFKLRDRARELRKQGKEAEAQELVQQVYEIMKFADQKIGLLPEEFSSIEDVDIDQEVEDLEALVYGQNPDVSLKVETVGNTRSKVIPGQKVGRGLTKRKVKGEVVVGDASGLSIDYVKENNPKAFIKNANIIKDYPIVKGKRKFRTATTVDQAQKIYDVFLREVADNLIYLHDRFETDLKDIATLWYDGANILSQNLSAQYNITPEQAAGMIASLSPQKDWYQNVRLAELVMIAFQENPTLTEEMITKQREVADEGLKEKAKDLKNRKITQEKYDKAETKAAETINWLRGFVGQDLNSVPDAVKPYIVRLSNEVKGDKDYNILSPDGSVVGPAIKEDGTNSKVAWGSYSEIGKAVSIYLDGSNSNISAVLGGAHKIRNFYNNIIDPNSLDGDVTMDTHAIAAALLLPLSGNSTQVTQNFGGAGTSDSDAKGHKGLYYAFSDAYALAADELGLLPRQVQSITWEAVRGLYSDTFKRNETEVNKVNDIWNRYEKNEITIEEARKLAEEAGGGITEPSWSQSVRGKRAVSLRGEAVARGAERVGPSTVGATERADGRVGAGVEDTYKTFTDILSKAFPGVDIIVDQAGFNEFKDDLLAMKLITNDSVVYGALVGNELYLNPEIQDYNTPIHEFGHVWLKMAKELRPDLYQKGLQLVEDSPYLTQVQNSPDYQKLFAAQKEAGLTDAQIQDLAKEEALATAIGDRGESFVNAAQKKDFKTWLNKLFDFVRKLVGISKLSAEQVQNLTFQEFIDSVVADILSGQTIFEGRIEADSLSMMAKSSKGDINQIVAKARENNFTDDVIRRFLERNGYNKSDIKAALEVKLDLFETLPQAYGNVKGGQELYNKVKTELQSIRKKADKALESEAGVKKYLNNFISPEELLGYDKVIEDPTVSKIAKAYGEALKTNEGDRTTKQKQIIYRVNQTVRNSVGDRVIAFLQNQPEYKALEKNNEWSKTESLIVETRDALGYKVRKTRKVIQDVINELTSVDKPTPETIKVTAKQLRSWAEKDSAMGAVAARKDQREIDRLKRQLRRDTVAALKDAVSTGKISTKQSVAIINKFDKINWSNPASRQKFVEYFVKIAEKAENIANLEEASRLRKDIKKAVKDKKKDAILRASANRFSALDPTLTENIEEYLEIAREIKNGLATSKPAFDANKADVYSAKETERQEKFAEDTFRMSFENITGIDSKDLTVAEMSSLLNVDLDAIMAKKEEDRTESEKEALKVGQLSEQKKREARAAADKLIEYYSAIADSIVSSNKDPFTGESLDLDESQRNLMRRLLKADLTKLETPELVRIAKMMSGFITNYEVGGLGAMVNQIERLENLDKLVKKGFKAKDLKLYWNKKIGGLWNTYLAPIPTVLDNMFGGVTRGAEVSRAIGFSSVVDGAAKTERESNAVFEALTDKYKDKGTAEAEFISDQNMVDLGVVGYVGRKPVTDNQALIAEEFEKRKQNLKDSIDNLRESGDAKDLKLADLYESAYERLIEGAANAEAAFDRLDNTQKEFITDLIGIFKGIKPLQDEVSLNVFNEVLGESENYLPDVYGVLDKTKRKQLTEEFIKSPTTMSSFAAFANSPLTKAGNFMKQTTPNGLKGSSKYVKLNLLENASQAYRNIMLDVNTAEDIRGMYAVLNSKAFQQLVPNAQDRALFRDRIDSYILNKKGKSGVVGNQDLNQFLNYFAKVATTKALGSLAQVPKQYIPVMTNTVINLGADANLLNLSLDADANAFIERSGKAIATRGIQSLATIESMNTLLDKGTYDNKFASYIEKAGDFWLQNFLVAPDVSIARASWMAYYKKSLKDQGLSTDIDFKNDAVNQKAADYAQSMVDRQQNVSDADLQGKFFTSRDTAVKAIRQLMFPFASFSTNQKARLFSDIATLNNESATIEDRRIAARSIAATITESLVFHTVSLGISALIYNIASGLMGGDEDDDYITKQIASRGLSIGKDLISPVPLFDPLVDGTFNSILDAAGVDEGFRTYGKFSDLTTLDMGVYSIPVDRITEATEALTLAIKGETGDKVISSSDQQAVTMAAIAMILHNGGVLPADFSSLARRIIKEAKAKAKTQKQIERELTSTKRRGLSVSGRGL